VQCNMGYIKRVGISCGNVNVFQYLGIDYFPITRFV